MHPHKEAILAETRRQFFARGAKGIAGIALANLMADSGLGSIMGDKSFGGLPHLPHFAPKAKRCIYLHMMGAPPQMDLLDYKPKMREWYDRDLPESVRQGQRLTTMTSGQARFPIAPSVFQFKQHGQNGTWISELLPYTAKMVDEIAIIRSMNTDAINHEPAITFIQTGRQVAGRPCIGSWISYGLGSMNEDLPTFVVMNAEKSHPKSGVQAISAKLWSSGFLSPQVRRRRAAFGNGPSTLPQRSRRRLQRGPPQDAGRSRRAEPDPAREDRQSGNIGTDRAVRDGVSNASFGPGDGGSLERTGKHFQALGRRGERAGQVQNAALLARRLVERGVRFVQIYHRGWDVHSPRPRSYRHRRGTSTGPPGPWSRI